MNNFYYILQKDYFNFNSLVIYFIIFITFKVENNC